MLPKPSDSCRASGLGADVWVLPGFTYGPKSARLKRMPTLAHSGGTPGSACLTEADTTQSGPMPGLPAKADLTHSKTLAQQHENRGTQNGRLSFGSPCSQPEKGYPQTPQPWASSSCTKSRSPLRSAAWHSLSKHVARRTDTERRKTFWRRIYLGTRILCSRLNRL